MKKHLTTILVSIFALQLALFVSCGEIDGTGYDLCFDVDNPSSTSNSASDWFKVSNIKTIYDDHTYLKLQALQDLKWSGVTFDKETCYLCDTDNPNLKYYLIQVSGENTLTLGQEYELTCYKDGVFTFEFDFIPLSTKRVNFYVSEDSDGDKIEILGIKLH